MTLKRRVRYIAIVVVALVCCSLAQVKEKVPAKPQPQEQRLEIPISPADSKPPGQRTETQRSSGLPKIDLPEFVITGIASIDLPGVEKEPPDENDVWLPRIPHDTAGAARDRNTIEVAVQEKRSALQVHSPVSNGKIEASLGTHFTPRVGFWLGQLQQDYWYRADLQYRSTKGFALNTNRSGGRFAAEGGMPLQSTSSWLDRATVGGHLDYGSETYRFFGSSDPSLTRTVAQFSLGGSLTSSSGSPLDYTAALAFKSLSVSDSSAKTTENRFDLALESRFSIASAALVGRVQIATASLSGSSSGSLPFVEVSVSSQRIWWHDFFADLSAHFYHAKSNLDQRLSKVYPHIGLGYVLLGNSTLSLTYRGEVEFGTLSSFLKSCQYLSVSSLLRNADVRADIAGALETDWNEVWRTRFSARYRSVRDYALLSELVPPGIWSMVYSGSTTLTTYAVDVFAKFNSNDYFGVTAALNSTECSVTEDKIPYVPDLEITGVLAQSIVPGWSVSPWMRFVDRRRVDVFGGKSIPAYLLLGLRTEYGVLQRINIFVDVQNLTDRRFEVWRGYRADPFMISAGASYRW